MSLIPEKPIVISPSLAATLGLEEAVLLQLLQECIAHGDTLSSSGFNWVTISGQKLLSLTPFWREEDIRRLSASLLMKYQQLRPQPNRLARDRQGAPEPNPTQPAISPTERKPLAAAGSRAMMLSDSWLSWV